MKQLSSVFAATVQALVLAFIVGISFAGNSYAADEVVDEYVYFAFEPDITTNYITQGSNIGFVRLTIEVMVKNADDLAIVEHHAPLLRAAVVEILGEQTEEKVKSMAGKQEIRELCFETLNQLLKEETGQKLIVRLLFTKYLHH